MAKKLYLSAAAHEHDNPTKCPVKCGENVHCKAYMDIVEKRLKDHGVDVKRGYRDEVGNAAMQHRVAEANKWGADLYYVAHTNAGGGRYTMTMCWTDKDSKAKAAVIGKYRKSIAGHKVTARPDLYEIRKTKMTTLYDELFFHDNADDCKWFHSGGMEIMAEETVQALCELLGIKYVAPVKKETATTTDKIYRVQIGAYRDRKNAETLVKKLKEIGFDAIIV
jgi:N-acetylmuramoyl-L-alanine amidase